MPKIKGTELVEKRNILNEIRQNNMTLQQLRFFSIYLAKINARDLSTRIVRFPLADFQKIMGLGKINIQNFRTTVDSLLRNVIHIPNSSGGIDAFTLFKKCSLFKDEYDNWYVEINANDEALPLMFDFKSHYFTYQLWNALQLKSATQIRIYELLKQYEYIGKREIEVSELRELLGIAPNEYPRFSNFKIRILDSCQKALAENTDICFTYERGKVGERGKWLTIVFHIKKNENYVDRLSLKDFIELQPEQQIIEGVATEISEPNPELQPQKQQSKPQQKQNFVDEEDDEEEESGWRNPHMGLYRASCDDEFSADETALLILSIDENQLPENQFGVPVAKARYLQRKYLELKYEAKQKPIKNRFKYLLKMVEKDFEID